MSEVLRLKRGSANAVASYTGPMGEIVVDVDNKVLYLQDGVTVGGIPVGTNIFNDLVTLASVFQRTDVADANYTVQITDQNIAFTSISALRTVSLLPASDYSRGMMLTTFDESGNCSYSNQIVISAHGTDLINGGASIPIIAPCGYISLTSNGTNKWTVVSIDATSVLANLGTTLPATPCTLWSHEDVIKVTSVLSEV